VLNYQQIWRRCIMKGKKQKRRERKIMKNTEDILFPNFTRNERGVIVRKKSMIDDKFFEINETNEAEETNDNFWECNLDMVSSCSKVPDTVVVKISPLVKKKIDFLMEKFKNLEWLAYLVGKDFYVEDLFIPDQVVSAASVNVSNNTVISDKPTIGVIHSHHSMNIGFSGTDDAYINMNHNISILVNHQRIESQVRVKTPCGAMKIVKGKVIVDLNINFDEKSFEETIDERIKTSMNIQKSTFINYL